MMLIRLEMVSGYLALVILLFVLEYVGGCLVVATCGLKIFFLQRCRACGMWLDTRRLR